MAYKKYIEKNGKIYGPYVYHSKRVGGKVISEYHGIKKEEKKYRKKILFVLGAMLLLFLIFWILFFSFQFSGKVILNISENYQEGEPIQGKINIELKQGELLPDNSKIIIENAENIYEFNINELIDTNTIEGNYFIEGIDLTGEGQGYGIIGSVEETPPIFFKLNITSEEIETTTEETIPEEPIEEEPVIEEIETTTEETIPEEPIEEEIETTTEETIPEEPIEETPPTITGGIIGSISLFFRGILTGNIIQEEIIQGDVSKNNPTEYNIQENSNVEIISGSVKTEEKDLSENVLNIDIENNQLTISTEYSEITEGFGKEFLGEETTTLSINLDELNIPLEEGDVTIKVIYQEIEIYSIQDTISPEQSIIETPEEPTENITNETITPINETNITEEIIENITVDLTFEYINLTEEEKELLKNKIGLIVVKTEVDEYKNKFDVLFTLGSYTMEHHYDLNLNETILKEQIDRDRTIWLKDLANKFSEEIILTERREDLDENYAVI